MFPYPGTTKKKGGVHVTAGPLDTCHTPTPGGPVPVPYANLVDGLSDSGDAAAIRTKTAIIRIQKKKGRTPKSATQAAISSAGSAEAQRMRVPGFGWKGWTMVSWM